GSPARQSYRCAVTFGAIACPHGAVHGGREQKEFEMALARTTYPVQGTTNSSHPVGTLAIRSQRVRRRNSSARTIFRRLLAAIVNGSDHPCWQTNDASTQLAMLPPRELSRLLDSGRVTTKR